MNSAANPTFAMLQECVAYDSDEAWRVFLEALRGLIHRAHRHCNQPATDREGFAAWFTGWFRVELKHIRTYAAVEAQSHPDEQSKDEHMLRYLWRVAVSGVREYARENRVGPRTGAKVYSMSVVAFVAVAPQPAENRSHKLDDVTRQLPRLHLNKRVPFRLRYYDVFGMPSADELDWISQQCHRSPHDVAADIAGEAQRHAGRTIVLSGEFVAALLGLDKNTYYQRVRRAWTELREMMGLASLGLSPEDPEPSGDEAEPQYAMGEGG